MTAEKKNESMKTPDEKKITVQVKSGIRFLPFERDMKTRRKAVTLMKETPLYPAFNICTGGKKQECFLPHFSLLLSSRKKPVAYFDACVLSSKKWQNLLLVYLIIKNRQHILMSVHLSSKKRQNLLLHIEHYKTGSIF